MFNVLKTDKKEITRARIRTRSLKRKILLAAASVVIALPSTVAFAVAENQSYDGPSWHSYINHTYWPNSNAFGVQSVTSYMNDYTYGHVSWSYITGANSGMGRVYSAVAGPNSYAVAYVSGPHDQFNGTYWDVGNSANGWPADSSVRVWWGM